VSIAPSDQTPSAATLASLAVVSPDTLLVQWNKPESDGGKAITKYRVEWDTVSTFNSAHRHTQYVLATDETPVIDVQSISTSVPPGKFLSGSFKVAFSGQTTLPLSYDISAADMQTALNDLCTVGSVTVSRNSLRNNKYDVATSQMGHTWPGHTWEITFTQMKYAGNQQTTHADPTLPNARHQVLDSHRLSVNGDSLLMCDALDIDHTGSSHDRAGLCRHIEEDHLKISGPTIDIGSKRETQVVHCRADTVGTVRLEFMGRTSASISTSADALQVEAALELMDSVGDVTVTFQGDLMTVCATAATLNGVLVTFESKLGDVPNMQFADESPEVTTLPPSAVSEVVKGRTQPVVGRLPYSLLISEGIETTSDWYVRVSAYNSIGYGTLEATSPSMARPARTVPMIARNISVSTKTSTALQVTWEAPVSNGGDPVTGYEIHWDTIDSFSSKCGDRAE